MNAKTMVLLLALLIPTAVFCLDYSVDYVYGAVEVQEDNRWHPVEIGTVVSADSSLRLGPGSVAELSSGSIRITLSEAGTYLVSELAKGSRQVSSWGIGQMVRGKIRNLFRGRPDIESTAMADFSWLCFSVLDRGRDFLVNEPKHFVSIALHSLTCLSGIPLIPPKWKS